MTLMTERAKLVAKLVHFEEKRRDEFPYYVHCDNVEEGVRGRGDIVESSAQMHDTLENSKNPNLIRMLLLEYFPPEVSHLVETLTHDKNIYYSHYIDVVCNNPDALLIKLADIIDNTKGNIPEKQYSKYREACIQMMLKGIEVPKILKERLKIEE